MKDHRYAYLHGFASGPQSRKGVALRDRLAARGVELWLPDLNQPSFSRLSHAAMLAHLDRIDAMGDNAAPWRFIGSSLGGWLAAKWAERRPKRVDSLVLLCPGFGLATRWPELFGEAAMEQWKLHGNISLPDGAGVETPLHYDFFTESQRHAKAPEVPCPTLIIHGKRDEVVPFRVSETYAKPRIDVSVIAVDDDHSLMNSLDTIEMETVRHFGL